MILDGGSPGGRRPTRWARGQRPLHWLLVVALGISWWTGSQHSDWHNLIGYGVGFLLLARVLLGFSRHPHAHWGFFFRQIARIPRALTGKTGQLPGQRSDQSQPVLSPLGAASALIILLLTAGTALTGWMLTWESFVGDDAAEQRHEWAFNLLLGWTVLHALAAMTTRLCACRLYRRGG